MTVNRLENVYYVNNVVSVAVPVISLMNLSWECCFYKGVFKY